MSAKSYHSLKVLVTKTTITSHVPCRSKQHSHLLLRAHLFGRVRACELICMTAQRMELCILPFHIIIQHSL